MIDDETLAKLSDAPGPRYGESMLYDFAKFLISLCLLTLGAMLTLGAAARAGEVKLANILLVIGTLAIAGSLAFTVAGGLADARARGREPSRHNPALIRLATAIFGVGVGTFIGLWLDTLK